MNLGTIALGRLQLDNHYADTALGGVLSMLALWASLEKIEAIDHAHKADESYSIAASAALTPISLYFGTKHRYAIAMGEIIMPAFHAVKTVRGQ